MGGIAFLDERRIMDELEKDTPDLFLLDLYATRLIEQSGYNLYGKDKQKKENEFKDIQAKINKKLQSVFNNS